MKIWQVALVAIALVIGLREALPRLMPARLPQMQALEAPTGFRMLPSGQVSAGNPALIGLEPAPQATDMGPARAEISADLCGALFAPYQAGQVPVAYFHDYQCPYCRVLSGELADTQGISLRRHLLDALGPASTLAAQAVLAAQMQGKGEALHTRLRRAPLVINMGLIETMAQSLDMDVARLATDMAGPEVAAELARAKALADLFRLPGTPAVVVGRTLAIGSIDRPVLQALIAQESDTLPCGD